MAGHDANRDDHPLSWRTTPCPTQRQYEPRKHGNPLWASRLFAELAGAASLAVIVIVFWIIFASLAPGFISPFNLFVISRTLAIDIVIGFSTMVVLATGGMNLAIGSIGVCSVMLAGYLIQVLGAPTPLALISALLLGAGLGWVNGFAIVRSGVNAFIITLASASLFEGGMLILSKAVIYDTLPPSVAAFGRMRLGPISPLLIIALGIGAALIVLFRFTAQGREILAAGANARAAELSGVPVGRAIMIAHTLSGLLAAAAGIMLLSRLGAAMPSIGAGLVVALLSRARPWRRAAQRRRGLRSGRDDRRIAGHNHSIRHARAADRQFLASAFSRPHAAGCGAARSLSNGLRRAPQPRAADMTATKRFFSLEWSMLAVAIAIGVLALSLLSPAFLSEYNLYVLLRSFCVVLVVAFAQMLTLAVGQLNLAIGALGGLVAIVVGGAMEKLGLPIGVAIALGLLLGVVGGWLNGVLIVRTGINGFIITLGDGVGLHRDQLRRHQVNSLLQSAASCSWPSAIARFWRLALSVDSARALGVVARGFSRPHAAGSLSAGGRRQSARGRALRHSARPHHRIGAHAVRPARGDRRHPRRRPAWIGAADDRRRLVAARPSPRRSSAARP